MKESIIKREILLELSKHPRIMLWNNPTGVARPAHGAGFRGDSGRYIRFGNPGEADLLGVIGPIYTPILAPGLGLAIAIETKTAKGNLSRKQVVWRDAFTAHGGIYILARSAENAQTEITNALRERGIVWEWTNL